jgi:hypothetical protein
MNLGSRLACLLLVLVSSALGQNVSPPPKLKAVAEDSMDVSYAADEKNLRKLNEIVRQRLSQLMGDSLMTYTVTFSDHSYYQVDSIETVLQEENPSTRGIISIQIFGVGSPTKPVPVPDPSKGGRSGQADTTKRSPADSQSHADEESPTIRLVLASHNLSYSVKGPNRDWVFNTQADIVDRFHIITTHTDFLRYVTAGLFGVAGFVICMMLFAVPFRKKYDSKLRALDANHKGTPLHKYILRTNDPDVAGFKSTMALQLSVLSAAALGFGGKLSGDYLWPGSVFEVGDQLAEYNRLLSLRGTLLWGVVVAFVLGIGASVIANLYTSNRRIAREPPS